MRGWWHAAGAEKTVCSGGACLAAVPGPSTSPLEDATRILMAGIRNLKIRGQDPSLNVFVCARAGRWGSHQERWRGWLRFVAVMSSLGFRDSLRQPASVCAEDAARAQ